MVAGATSDAGKTVLTAGICRWLARTGVRVAPFKGQNMALNSVVASSGVEVGRAQALQAAAAGIPVTAEMNPVLLKPSGERHSQVIVMGRPHGEADARTYRTLVPQLRPVVAGALATLRERFDVVIAEGAGSPTEINLRDSDLTNLWLAREAGMAVIVVVNIDHGGAFAALFGTLALLAPEDQAHIAGFVFNKFRGDAGLLAPGIERLTELTGRPTLGVVPYLDGPAIDAEDSLALTRTWPETAPEPGGDTLDVVVLAFRRISNFTDVDALATEPGVRVRFSRSPADVERADLVVLPGTKATVDDLAHLRAGGLDRALVARARAERPILGICGGYQMLGSWIQDDVESRRGRVDGLGLLPVTTTFDPDKRLERRAGSAPRFGPVGGYEIRHGRVARHGGEVLIDPDEGTFAGAVIGTSWHGALEHDRFRRALLGWVADRVDRRFVPGSHTFGALRAARLDALGDLVEAHLDLDALTRLIRSGPPSDLPTISTEVRTLAGVHHHG